MEPSGSKPSNPGYLKPGDVFAGRYEVLRIVGHGGMGVVYEARCRETGLRVALKTILPRHLTNPRAAERFLREMDIARQLRHPNIAAVLDAGSEGRIPYFTMEFLEGTTLRGMMTRRGRIPLRQAVWILRRVTDGLAYAHDKKIVHRDLSPENVMVLPDGTVKLLDFGLARAMEEPVMTAPGTAMGKAYYIAPEQRKDPSGVDGRADLYSLGVMFFEMLSGQMPTGYHRLAELVPELPPACDQLASRALAPVDSRLATVTEFRRALDACQEDAPPDRAAGGIWTGKGRKWAAGVAGVLFLACAVAGVVLVRRDTRTAPLTVTDREFPPSKPSGTRGLEPLEGVWKNQSDAASPVRRIDFNEDILQGKSFTMELAGMEARGAYSVEGTGRVFHVIFDFGSMGGDKKGMLQFDKRVRAAALARIDDIRMTLALDRRWVAAALEFARIASVTPSVTNQQALAARAGELTAAQRKLSEASGAAAPAALDAGEAVQFVLVKDTRYGGEQTFFPQLAGNDQVSLDTLVYPAPEKKLSPEWTVSGRTATLRLTETTAIEFVRIEPGEFMMGTDIETGGAPGEWARHKVSITKPFWMGKHEVTQAQWKAVMGVVPCNVRGEDLPVDMVSWEDAQLFIRRVNEASDQAVRLPTEAEWEYAARGGTEGTFYWGESPAELVFHAWIAENSDKRQQPVGKLAPNPFGLHDVYGNVWEWCGDLYDPGYYRQSPQDDPQGSTRGTERVARGGCFTGYPRDTNSYFRNRFPPAMRRMEYGLRLCASAGG